MCGPCAAVVSSKLAAAGSSCASSAPSRKIFQPVTANVTGVCQVRCGLAFVGEAAATERGAVALGRMTTTCVSADGVTLPAASVAVTT